ncbi:TetR/AcrR family transcriptional regulator [Herbiconiux solani]|uniref:TetR/AcrR family transcriptional regulator n=1 Tax=Herbiconiux solani TaxID=661329 RepID=UPI0008255920|nr:TetR/AcrR family transcriptional regulator [Herbiconiux solani]
MTLTAKAESTRGAILAAGEDLILAKGFTGVGLQQILTACGVPKGSFYHYFSSKEGFGVAVLERYVETYLEAVEGLLSGMGSPTGTTGTGATARDRLRMLGDAWAGHAGEASADRCLVVKLAAEVSSFSEPMRLALADGVARLVALMAGVVAEGQQDGSITSPCPAAELAESLYELWLGAALLDRISRDGTPFVSALRTTSLLLD